MKVRQTWNERKQHVDRQRFRHTENGLDSAIYMPPKHGHWNAAWVTTERIIETMHREILERGKTFVVVTLTNPIQVDPDEHVRHAFCESLGVPNLRYPDDRITALGRKAGFSVVRMNTSALPACPAGDAATQTAFLLDAVNTAGPSKYQGYKLLEKGPTTFAGAPFGHIVYEGQEQGKDIRWWRMIVMVPPGRSDFLVMLIFSTPVNDRAKHEAAFRQIEQNWQWIK